MIMQVLGYICLCVICVGIDIYQQLVVYMYCDCEVCCLEGFVVMMCVRLDVDVCMLVVMLNVVIDDWFGLDEVVLLEVVWMFFDFVFDVFVGVRYVEFVVLVGVFCVKVFGVWLDDVQYFVLVQDVMESRLLDLEFVVFVIVSVGDCLDYVEMIVLM